MQESNPNYSLSLYSFKLKKIESNLPFSHLSNHHEIYFSKENTTIAHIKTKLCAVHISKEYFGN